MNNDPRIRKALENAEANVELLATMSDKELAIKLNLIHLQSEIAVQKKMTSSIELLEIWRSQVIAARIYKAENNIPDAPNEIELAIADIETVVSKTKQRKKNLNEFNNPVMQPPPKVQSQHDNDSQLSLFL